jgi:hypothetical protein
MERIHPEAHEDNAASRLPTLYDVA